MHCRTNSSGMRPWLHHYSSLDGLQQDHLTICLSLRKEKAIWCKLSWIGRLFQHSDVCFIWCIYLMSSVQIPKSVKYVWKAKKLMSKSKLYNSKKQIPCFFSPLWRNPVALLHLSVHCVKNFSAMPFSFVVTVLACTSSKQKCLMIPWSLKNRKCLMNRDG